MKKDLYSIIKFYGSSNQLKKLSEELYELQEAIIQYEDELYHCENPEDLKFMKEHIEEEFADTLVLLKQLKIFYKLNRKKIKKIIKQKVARQLNRIKKERNEYYENN